MVVLGLVDVEVGAARERHPFERVAEGRSGGERRRVAGALAGFEGEPGDVDQRDDVAGAGIDGGHDRAAVGVADEHDGPSRVRTRSVSGAASAATPRSGLA